MGCAQSAPSSLSLRNQTGLAAASNSASSVGRQNSSEIQASSQFRRAKSRTMSNPIVEGWKLIPQFLGGIKPGSHGFSESEWRQLLGPRLNSDLTGLQLGRSGLAELLEKQTDDDDDKDGENKSEERQKTSDIEQKKQSSPKRALSSRDARRVGAYLVNAWRLPRISQRIEKVSFVDVPAKLVLKWFIGSVIVNPQGLPMYFHALGLDYCGLSKQASAMRLFRNLVSKGQVIQQTIHTIIVNHWFRMAYDHPASINEFDDIPTDSDQFTSYYSDFFAKHSRHLLPYGLKRPLSKADSPATTTTITTNQINEIHNDDNKDMKDDSDLVGGPQSVQRLRIHRYNWYGTDNFILDMISHYAFEGVMPSLENLTFREKTAVNTPEFEAEQKERARQYALRRQRHRRTPGETPGRDTAGGMVFVAHTPDITASRIRPPTGSGIMIGGSVAMPGKSLFIPEKDVMAANSNEDVESMIEEEKDEDEMKMGVEPEYPSALGISPDSSVSPRTTTKYSSVSPSAIHAPPENIGLQKVRMMKSNEMSMSMSEIRAPLKAGGRKEKRKMQRNDDEKNEITKRKLKKQHRSQAQKRRDRALTRDTALTALRILLIDIVPVFAPNLKVLLLPRVAESLKDQFLAILRAFVDRNPDHPLTGGNGEIKVEFLKEPRRIDGRELGVVKQAGDKNALSDAHDLPSALHSHYRSQTYEALQQQWHLEGVRFSVAPEIMNESGDIAPLNMDSPPDIYGVNHERDLLMSDPKDDSVDDTGILSGHMMVGSGVPGYTSMSAHASSSSSSSSSDLDDEGGRSHRRRKRRRSKRRSMSAGSSRHVGFILPRKPSEIGEAGRTVSRIDETSPEPYDGGCDGVGRSQRYSSQFSNHAMIGIHAEGARKTVDMLGRTPLSHEEDAAWRSASVSRTQSHSYEHSVSYFDDFGKPLRLPHYGRVLSGGARSKSGKAKKRSGPHRGSVVSDVV